MILNNLLISANNKHIYSNYKCPKMDIVKILLYIYEY